MQITGVPTETLFEQASEYTGIDEREELIRAALTALIEREAARSLATMGGSQPGLKRIRRRRF